MMEITEPKADAPLGPVTGLREVFVAAPFWRFLQMANGVVPDGERQKIMQVIEYFEALGCEVHNAHRREGWGTQLMEPLEFTRHDYDGIAASDLFVAFPGAPASPGTHVELGWASALGKPMVVIMEADEEYAGLVVGLGSVGVVEEVVYRPGDDLVPMIAEATRRVLGRAAATV